MSAVAGGLALAGVSAVASSSSHALLKSSGDKFAMQAWAQFTPMAVALPFTLWVGLPEPAIYPWLLSGWALHSVYYLVLIWSYTTSDYSAAYPIARGVIPIFTAVLGILLLGDKLTMLALMGIAVISIGILMLSLNQSVTRTGLIAAGLSGLINTGFTLTDAKGMRIAQDPMNFLVWYYIIDGFTMPLLFAARSRGRFLEAAKASARTGLTSGLLALFAFLPTLVAFRIAPVGAVSAIRATSVIFSLLIGGQLLNERLESRRIGGAMLVTFGALAIIGSTTFL
jgi:drug/metabolite transporter (DMT)-like permease